MSHAILLGGSRYQFDLIFYFVVAWSFWVVRFKLFVHNFGNTIFCYAGEGLVYYILKCIMLVFSEVLRPLALVVRLVANFGFIGFIVHYCNVCYLVGEIH